MVRAKSKPLFGAAGKAISAQDISVFSRQIATMLQSGVPMVQSFEILASGQKNPRMRDMLIDIRDNISGGSSLSEAMARHPVQFDLLYRNLTRAGESAGVLDTVLDTVATYKERIEALKGKIKKALFYPAAVMAVAILVSAILLLYVVPQFETVFRNFGSELPAFTQMIVNASRFLTSYWWLIVGATVGALVGFMFLYKRSPSLERSIPPPPHERSRGASTVPRRPRDRRGRPGGLRPHPRADRDVLGRRRIHRRSPDARHPSSARHATLRPDRARVGRPGAGRRVGVPRLVARRLERNRRRPARIPISRRGRTRR